MTPLGFESTNDRQEIGPVMPATEVSPDARYCAATFVGKFDRRCVRSPYPDNAGHPNQSKDTR
jgi:hypothetical protein